MSDLYTALKTQLELREKLVKLAEDNDYASSMDLWCCDHEIYLLCYQIVQAETPLKG